MIGVAVATFGDPVWQARGDNCADQTAATLTGDFLLTRVHLADGCLADARNQAAAELAALGADHLVFLDADDRLHADYVAVLEAHLIPGTALLYQPQTQGLWARTGTLGPVDFIADRDMNTANNLVVGTAMRTCDFVGFDPTLAALEDWDLFLRMLHNGVRVRRCPGMVYVVGMNEDYGGARNAPGEVMEAAYWAVVSKHRSRRRARHYLYDPPTPTHRNM